MSLEIISDAFAPNQPIPKKYSGDGENASPPLKWNGLPPLTKELALVADDPDAPQAEPFVHWVLYKLPADSNGLAERVARDGKLAAPPGALQGRNSMRKLGYDGPAPPRGHGVHHYHFKLFALDKPLDVREGMDAKSLAAAMSGHILEQTEVVGIYER